MDAYIYQAALWCEDCARAIRDQLRHGTITPDTDETEYDSDDYPKGPYPDGGGESDTPGHCDGCGVFLENSLTSDGDEYVARSVLFALIDKRPDAVCITQWLPCYDYIALADVIEQARNAGHGRNTAG